MDKLSELSKPVAWIIGEESIEEFTRGYETFVVRGDDVDSTEETMKLYSQEYVSALQHESAVNWEAAASLNVENQDLKKRIAELEGILEVSRGDLSDTEDAMRLWAERAEVAEAKLATSARPVGYAPKGHIQRYMSGDNSGCWIYGKPIADDSVALYSEPQQPLVVDRKSIISKVHVLCSRIPGATFANAAEFALDEVDARAKGLRDAGFTVEGGGSSETIRNEAKRATRLPMRSMPQPRTQKRSRHG